MEYEIEEMAIGNKLKELRKVRNMTLTQLAEATNLSPAYISNIERNQTSPTVNNLFKISTALGVEIIDIMADTTKEKDDLVTTKEQRENLFKGNTGIIYESIIGKKYDLSGVCITINENCYEEVFSTGHSQYGELGIQAEGSLVIKYGNQESILNVGDTIYIPKSMVHGYVKYGEGRCVTYWVHAKDDSEF